MTDIKVTREETDAGGRYVAVVDRAESEMTFMRANRRGQAIMIIDHTGVPSSLAGKGVGLALVRYAVEDARAGNFRILPHCSFVRAMMARHKDWQDVLVMEA